MIAKIDALVNDGLRNVVSHMGTGHRDSTVSDRWRARTAVKTELEAAYRNWLVAKCVDIPVDDAFKKDRYIVADDATRIPEFYEIENRFGVKDKFVHAAKIGRLYGGAAVIIGTNDISWADPLTERSHLTHIFVLNRHDFSNIEINSTNFREPNYRDAQYYQIGGERIHYSRVIRFDGDRLPHDLFATNGYWHGSIVDRLSDAIKPAQNAVQNLSILINQISTDIFKVPGLLSKVASMGDESAMINRFEIAAYMRSNLNMMLLDSEEDYQRIAAQISGVPDTMIGFMRLVAGAADIPATRLLGDAASGLNATGEGDLRNYYDGIAAAQSTVYAPKYNQIDPLLCRMVWGTTPAGFRSMFEPLWQMSDTERATVDLQRAQADNIYLTAGVLTPAIVAQRLQENETYSIDSEYVTALESYKTEGNPA